MHVWQSQSLLIFLFFIALYVDHHCEDIIVKICVFQNPSSSFPLKLLGRYYLGLDRQVSELDFLTDNNANTCLIYWHVRYVDGI